MPHEHHRRDAQMDEPLGAGLSHTNRPRQPSLQAQKEGRPGWHPNCTPGAHGVGKLLNCSIMVTLHDFLAERQIAVDGPAASQDVVWALAQGGPSQSHL